VKTEMDELLDLEEESLTELVKEIPTPEELVGKPYSAWVPPDMEKVRLAYGDDLTNKIIFSRELKQVRRMEAKI
jgi:hypothetical protein